MRTFPQHPCDVSPLPCAQYRSLRPLFSVFPGVSSSTFRLSLPLPSFLPFSPIHAVKVPLAPLHPFPSKYLGRSSSKQRRRTPPRLNCAEWETVRDIFLPGSVARYFPAVVYLLLPSLSVPLLLVHRVTPPLCFERNIRPTRIRDDDGTPLCRR